MNKIIIKNNKITYIMIGGIIGTLIFGFLFGYEIVIPTFTSWILTGEEGDLVLVQSGWEFFRRAEWRWPIGQYIAYPYPLINSIVYTDSLPLFAIPLKIFRSILPEKFQYWGIWCLFCYIMQGIMGMLIFKQKKVNLAGSIVALPFLFINLSLLLQSFLHFSLMGQWTILWALLIYFSDSEPRSWKYAFAWLINLVVSMLACPYLFFINGIVFAFALLKQYLSKKNIVQVVISLVVNVVSCVFVMYVIGGFGVTNPGDVLGTCSLNLNSWMNPYGLDKNTNLGTSVSSFWSRLPVADVAQWEASAYLGMGLFFLILGCLIVTKKGDILKLLDVKKNIVDYLLLLASLIIALSPRITFGDKILVDYSALLPTIVLKLGGIIRSTARITWIINYFIIINVVSYFYTKVRRQVFYPVIIMCIVIQCIDILPLSVRNYMTDLHIDDEYTNEFIEYMHDNEAIADSTEHIVYVANGYPPIGGEEIKIYASTNGITLNAGYFARYSLYEKSVVNNEIYLKELMCGELRPGYLYCFDLGYWQSHTELLLLHEFSNISVDYTDNYVIIHDT